MGAAVSDMVQGSHVVRKDSYLIIIKSNQSKIYFYKKKVGLDLNFLEVLNPEEHNNWSPFTSWTTLFLRIAKIQPDFGTAKYKYL